MKRLTKYVLGFALVLGIGCALTSCGGGHGQYGCPERISTPNFLTCMVQP